MPRSPEVIEYQREWKRKWRAIPENRAKLRASYQTPQEKARRREYYLQNRERIKARNAQHYHEHKEIYRERSRQWRVRKRKENPEYMRRRSYSGLVKRKYGIDLIQVESMRVAQGNRCACCKDEFRETPHIDHDHVTGNVRALLCRGCNNGLGCFQDSTERLSRAITYLKSYDTTSPRAS